MGFSHELDHFIVGLCGFHAFFWVAHFQLLALVGERETHDWILPSVTPTYPFSLFYYYYYYCFFFGKGMHDSTSTLA